MSLVSTWVRATDGFLYQNPKLHGKGWFICFDDDDPVELVISNRSKKTPKEIFEKLGMKHTKLIFNGIAGRCFGKGYNFTWSKSWFFEIKNNINPKFISYYEKKVKSSDNIGQGVFYDFKK